MKQPNLRYGNPAEFAFYVQGVPIKDVARRLRRSERSVRNWLDGKEKMPWWIPELLRLQRLENADRMRQMNMTPIRSKLGLATAGILTFPALPPQHQPKESQNENETPCIDHPGITFDGLRIHQAG